MQRMSMKSYKHGVPNTYSHLIIKLLRVFMCVSCVISSFYENFILCTLLQNNNMQQN